MFLFPMITAPRLHHFNSGLPFHFSQLGMNRKLEVFEAALTLFIQLPPQIFMAKYSPLVC